MNTMMHRKPWKMLLAIATTGALTFSAQVHATPIVSGGTLLNNFNNSSQLDHNGTVVYAVGVGNSSTGSGGTGDLTVGGYDFLHDSNVGVGDSDPNLIPGVTSTGAKSFAQNTPAMPITADSASLDKLLKYNRFGNANGPMNYTLTVKPNTVYELQLAIWENYFTTAQRTMSIFIDGTTTSNSLAYVTNMDTVGDLAGPVASNAFLYKLSFMTPSSGPNSTSLTIHMTAFVTGSPASPSSPILSAIILTSPEPASLGVLALGCIGLLRRKQIRAI